MKEDIKELKGRLKVVKGGREAEILKRENSQSQFGEIVSFSKGPLKFQIIPSKSYQYGRKKTAL